MRRSRGLRPWFGAALAAAFALTAWPAGASAAAGNLKVTPVEVRRALFVAGDVDRLSTARGERDVVLERLLQRMYALQPALPARTAAPRVRRLAAALPERLPSPAALGSQGPNERILTILTALDTPRPAGVVGRALTLLLRDAVVESADTGVSGERFTASADELSTLSAGTFSPSATLSATAALADRLPAFARARDVLWAASSSERSTDTTKQLVARNPALQSDAIKPLTDLIDTNGGIDTTQATVTAVYRSALRAMSATVTDSFSAARSPGGDATFRAGAEARQKVLAGANAATAMAAALAAAPTKNPAEDLATVAKAVYGYAQAANQYAKTAKGILEVGTSLGKAVMTRNVAQAAVAILDAVLAFGPSDDEVILEQLGAIQNQIAEFRDEVDRRFDALAGQVSALGTRFDEVDVALLELSRQIDRVRAAVTGVDATVRSARNEVVRLQASLDRVEANLYRIADADRNRDLWETINFVLGYRQRSRTGAALPEVELERAEAKLFTFATTTAADEVSEPAVGRSFAADDLVSELGRVPLEGNLDFLRSYPFAAGWTGFPTPLTDQRVANPRLWAVAARAYAQLLAENPGRVTPEHLGRLAIVAGEGRKLAALAERIGVRDRATGPGSTGSALFDALLDRYRAAMGLGATRADGSLIAAIQQAEADYLAPLTGPTPDIIYGEKPHLPDTMPLHFDPWAGPSQAASVPDRVSSPRCETGPGFDPARRLPIPNRYVYVPYVERPRRISRGPFELPVEVRFARDLGLGDVRNCWRADYQRTLERGVELVTTLRVHLVWQWVPKAGSAPMDVMEIGGYLGRYSGRSDPPDSPDDALFAPDALRQIGAETLLPDTRDLHGAWDLQDGQVVARIRAAVVAELQRRQRDIYARVRDGIRGSGPLHDAARRVTGIRDLLEAYIAVGLADAAADDDRLRALRLIAEDAAPAALGATAPDRRISTVYARAATAEDTPATNVRTMLAGEATRVDALQAALRDVLGGAPAGARGTAAATSDTAGSIASRGTDDRGTLPIVRATLTRLAATDAVIRGYPTTRQSRRSPAGRVRAALKLR